MVSNDLSIVVAFPLSRSTEQFVMSPTRRNQPLTPSTNPELISLPSHDVERCESSRQGVGGSVATTAAFSYCLGLTGLYIGILSSALGSQPPAGPFGHYLAAAPPICITFAFNLGIILVVTSEHVRPIRLTHWRGWTCRGILTVIALTLTLLGPDILVVNNTVRLIGTSPPSGESQ